MSADRPGVPAAGVLLVGHGTRDRRGTEEFLELGGHLRARLEPLPVEPSLLEFQRPSIAEAWQKLVDRNVRHIHVAPLLLFAAGHAKDDIPQIVADCQARTPHITVDQSRPISRAPSLIRLVVRRLQGTLDRLDVRPDRIAVIAVGRGSHDPCAQADMRVLAEIVRTRVDAASLATAFYAMAQPRLPEVIDRIARSGRYDAIVIHPHLLFDGRLFQAISKQTDQAADRFPDIRFAVSPYLGPDALVADAIARRIFPCRDSVRPVDTDRELPAGRE